MPSNLPAQSTVADPAAIKMQNVAQSPRRRLPADCAGKKRGFSLIEVMLAIGVFSFGVLSIVGLMATGLDSTAGSRTNLAIANITRQLRASLQAAPYSSIASGTSYSFSYGGYPVTSATGAYYTAVLTPVPPAYPSSGQFSTSTNASIVRMVIMYPYPSNAISGGTSSLFVAR